jgi:hypothetical protein
MPEPGFDILERELVELGRSITTAPPRDDLVDAVLARIGPVAGMPEVAGMPDGAGSADSVGSADEDAAEEGADSAGPGTAATSAPGRRFGGRRLGWAIAAAVVLLLALIPPVRAAVLELLRIGGVVVREAPAPRGLPTSQTQGPTLVPEPGATPATLAAAERAVGFPIAVPAALGPPTQVAVARGGRVAELTWLRNGQTTRLDVFAGSLSWGYLKTVWNDITSTQVNGKEAVWFGSPHLIEWVDHGGTTHRDEPRLAGPTLVWVAPGAAGEVTYRLEGPVTLAAAVEVAQSAR